MAKATERREEAKIEGVLLVVEGSDDMGESWVVFTVDGSGDITVLSHAATRQEAVSKAVAVLEAMTAHLQGPPPA